MKTGMGKRIGSGILALALTATMYVGSSASVFAGDTLPYIDHSAKGENQPYSHGWRGEDLLDWSPETDPYAEYMRAQIPLQNRNEAFAATQAHPDLSSEVQLFNLSADYGIAFFDSYPYTNQFSQHIYNFWQYTDYYGSWHGLPTEEVPESMYDAEGERNGTSDWSQRKFEFGLINMPNPGYTNAAHKNGVLSIGCIFLPRPGLKPNILFTQDETGRFPYADKLVELCKYYGFDGYFINQEDSVPRRDIALYKKFMKQMRDAGLYVQWYDAVDDTTGVRHYENEFNSANDSYFYEDDESIAPVGTQYASSIFLNYGWNRERLTNSANLATSLGLNPREIVFSGLEANMHSWKHIYDLRDGLDENGQLMNSLALFSADFVHSALDEQLGVKGNTLMLREKDEFQWMTFERERRWYSGPFEDPSLASTTADRSTYEAYPEVGIDSQKFDGVAAYIAERSVINGDTFVTNFNTGHGLEYKVNGEASGNSEWSNIIIQDILPTWQWWVDTDGTRLNVDFDYGAKYKKNYYNGSGDVYGKEGNFDFDLIGAYNGGSSLVIYGKVDAENFIHLYKTDLDVNEASKMDITFQKTSEDNAQLKLGVIFKDDPDTIVKLDVANSASMSNGWVTSTVDLSAYAGRKIAAFGLVVDGEAADYQMNIGQMKYTSGEADIPEKPTGLTIEKAYQTGEMMISWDMAPYDEVKQYNVYAVKDGKEIFLGGTYDEVFYIKNVNEAIAEAEAIHVDSVTVSPKEVNAAAGDTVDFDAKVNGYTEEAGQVTIVLKAVSADGTESEGAMASHNYDEAVSNVQVTAEDGKLNVTWEGGQADVAVTKEYSTDNRVWTASGENGCTVEVPTGAEADYARYTMTITTETGAVTTYDGRMDDSYSRPYNGKIDVATGRLDVPLSKDWYQMVYTTIKDGQESSEVKNTRYTTTMPTIKPDVDAVKVKLIDYRGNESEWVEVPNCICVIAKGTSSRLQAGKSMQMQSTVLRYQETDAVVWSIWGNTSADTKIGEDGVLTVSKDEGADTIVVTAASVEEPKALSDVNVRIDPAYSLKAEKTTAYQSDQVVCKVIDKETSEEQPAEKYEWSVSQNQSEGTRVENGILTIAENEKASRITVTAENRTGASYSATITVNALYRLSAGKTTIYPGDTVNINVTNQKTQTAAPPEEFKWSVSAFSGSISENTAITDGVLVIDEKETASSLKITAESKAGAVYTVSVYIRDPYALSPLNPRVEKGSSQQFEIKHASSGDSAPAEDYTWTIATQNARLYGEITSADTKVQEDGLLFIGEDETCTRMALTAVHKETGKKYTTSVTPTEKANAVMASAQANTAEAPVPAPAPTNDDPAVSQEVVWTVEGANSADTKVDENGTLTIGIDETAEQLYVTATSAADETKSDTAVVNVTPKEKYYVEVIAGEHGTVTPGSGEYYEGTDVTFTFTPDEGYAVDKVTVDGKEVLLTDGKYTLTVTGTTQIEASFKASPDAPDTGDYTTAVIPLLFAMTGGVCLLLWRSVKRIRK